METNGDRRDVLIDWLFRAGVGFEEIHDMTPPTSGADDPLATRYLVVTRHNHGLIPGLFRLEQLGLVLWVVQSRFWVPGQTGRYPLPEGFGQQAVRSWRRTSAHDDNGSWVESIALANFRGFESTRLDFSRRANLLMGQNGAGKTAILDALALGLGNGLKGLQWSTANTPLNAHLDDVRVARIAKGGLIQFERQLPMRIDVDMRLCGELIHPGTVVEKFGDVGLAVGSRRPISPFDYADLLRWLIQCGLDVTLPLVAYYGRIFGNKQDRATERDESSRLSAYQDCLNPSTNLASMRAWFRRMELMALQDGTTPAILTASKDAILGCLEGFDMIRYDARLDDLAARSKKTGVLLAFDQLSDGQKNVLGMVADMAYRAATLNPHLRDGVLEKTPGIVLIDEIDQHLHPAWQRRIVRDLRSTFPNVQFIMTTHSPQVLSEVPREEIILLDHFHAYAAAAPTEGRDTNSILEEVFGVPAHPRETVEAIRIISELIDEGRYVEAKEKLSMLAQKVTERDPDVARLLAMLDVVERIDATDPQGT